MSFFDDDRFEKWLWVELIGFDRDLPDCGVAEYLARAGFVPTGVSLLLTWTGFVLDFDGFDRERPLHQGECSYYGHPANPERRRQVWTNLDLRRLIDTLHARGIRVYLSFFNYASTGCDAGVVKHPFFEGKETLYEYSLKGRTGTLGMLKRMPDGSFFADTLIAKTVAALTGYGFDGLQLADGLSSPRVSLQEGDYSDDMAEQFADFSGLTLDTGCGNDPERCRARAELIWQEHRAQWLDFWRARWTAFYRKLSRAIDAAGKEYVFNAAWTRDPFEARYRYGVDYRTAADAGARGMMAEDVGAGLAILSERDNGYLMTDAQRRRIHYQFQAALMLTRAALPDGKKLLPLAGIHDMQEQWGVLEHQPTAMLRNVATNLNTYLRTSGGLRPIIDGPWYCLADSITPAQWEFIRSCWDISLTPHPVRTAGVTLLWSDERLERELEAFINTRRTPTHQLLAELLYHNAPVHTIVRNIADAEGDVLVTNPDLLSEDERAAVQAYDRVWLLGGTLDGFREVLTEKAAFGTLALSCREAAESVCLENPAAYAFDPKTSREPVGMLWTHPLEFAPWSDDFFSRAANILTDTTDTPTLTAPASCKHLTVWTSENSCRVFLGNDDYWYNHPTAEFGREIATARCLTKYDGFPVPVNGTSFTLRVPPRGMEIVEITLK
ncbi:MAG: hypothetical protein ACOXZM_07110 [Eubacteriales bacterium]